MTSVSRLSGPPEKGVKKIAHAIYHIVSRKSDAKLQPHRKPAKCFQKKVRNLTSVNNPIAYFTAIRQKPAEIEPPALYSQDGARHHGPCPILIYIIMSSDQNNDSCRGSSPGWGGIEPSSAQSMSSIAGIVGSSCKAGSAS